MNDRTILLIRVTHDNEKNEQAAENFFAQLSEILKGKEINLSAEIVIYNKFLWFFLTSPSYVADLVKGQWYSQYGNVEIETTRDYINKFFDNTKTWSICGTEFKLEHTEYLPITTYKELEKNPLTSLSGIASSFHNDDLGSVQLVFHTSPKESIFFKFKKKLREENRGKRTTSIESVANYTKLEDEKDEKPFFKTTIRFLSASRERRRAELNLASIIAVYKKTLERPRLQKFKEGSIRFDNRFLLEYRNRVLSNHLFGRYRFRFAPDEIATFFHLPYKSEGISQVVEVMSKKAPPSENLPTQRNTTPSEITIFGKTNFHNVGQLFGIKIPDRRRHLYIIGKTGMGKSKLLELLIGSDLKTDKGIILLDPHGDLAKEVLNLIPEKRIKDVVYFDPSDLDFPIGFNPMEGVGNFEFKQNIVVGFISIFKKLFGLNWNERFEHVLRYTTLALLDYPSASVLGIPRMLTDNLFRQDVLRFVFDPLVKKFWTTEFSAWNEQFAGEAIVPIINKIGQFVANPMIRNIVGQAKTGFSLEEIMNKERILIANLSIGKLGEENSALLGSMLVTKIWQTAIARSSIREEDRKDTFLYVDEFQNFATSAFANILSEARKYRLNLTFAHQYIEQLPEEVRATIFGNVGNIISFRVGGEDAQVCVKEFEPIFNVNDFLNLDMRNFFIKMSINGQTSKPFSAITLDVEKSKEDKTQKIIESSRKHWSKTRKDVEEEIQSWESGRIPSAKIKVSQEEVFPEPII